MSTYKWFSDPVSFDIAAADTLVNEAFKRQGYYQANGWVDNAQISKVCGELFVTKHHIKSMGEYEQRPDLAAWKVDIGRGIFPGEPVLAPGSHTPEEDAAASTLYSQAWTWSAANNDQSLLNRALSQVGGFVAIEAKMRKGGAPAAPARFVTKDPQLILEHKVEAYALVKYERAVDRFEAQLKEIAKRRPEIALPMAKALDARLPGIHSRMVHADPKAIRRTMPSAPTALPGGDTSEENDDSDESGG